MPKNYDTDGQGGDAVAFLHYFTGSWDWYITEKDVDSDDKGQIQAFGLVKGYETELAISVSRRSPGPEQNWTCTGRLRRWQRSGGSGQPNHLARFAPPYIVRTDTMKKTAASRRG
ncbi:hypothetical protein [Acidithiobacillus sp.]